MPPRQTLSGTLRHPQVLCIITQHLWVTTYFKVSILDNRPMGSFLNLSFLCDLRSKFHCTTSDYLAQVQVLQVAEALLKQSDVLTGPALPDLPYISPTARFLDQVAEHFSIIYEPGQVTTGALHYFTVPVHWLSNFRCATPFIVGHAMLLHGKTACLLCCLGLPCK